MNEQKTGNQNDEQETENRPARNDFAIDDAGGEQKTENGGKEELKQESKIKKRIKKLLIILGIILIVFIGVEFISAAKYKTVVVVADKQGVVGINPLTESLDFGELSKGSSISRFVTLKSQGKISTFVIVVITGGIKDLIEIDKNYFTLSGGEEQKIDFHLDIPISADKEKYKGRVFIFRLPKI